MISESQPFHSTKNGIEHPVVNCNTLSFPIIVNIYLYYIHMQVLFCHRFLKTYIFVIRVFLTFFKLISKNAKKSACQQFLCSSQHSVEKRGTYSNQRKLNEINYLVKPLLSCRFCQKIVRENFLHFHTVLNKHKAGSTPKS